jgi:hypothetical protein
VKQDDWKQKALCLGSDTNDYFDKYEEDTELRSIIDSVCQECPVRRICFANGISGQEYGVWGGVYLEKGSISREFNKHKSKQAWGETWQALTTEK